ncbi:MAG: hypothetical protein ACRCR2_01175 [Fusobacteriaceae bacterium]
MLEKGKIVSSALLFLGEVREYNNNNYEIHKVALELMEEVMLEFSTSRYLRSNLDYRKLTKKTTNLDPEGRFVYNIPVDCLTLVRAVNNEPFEEMGETIHSYSDTLTLVINRKIPFEEVKLTYFTFLKLMLCKKIAEVYPQFQDKLQYINQNIAAEELKLSIAEAPKHLSYIDKQAFGRGY